LPARLAVIIVIGMAEFAEATGPLDNVVPTRHQQPDGSAVQAQVRIGPGGAVISDAGVTVERIRQKLSQRLPQRVRLTIEGICRMNDLQFTRGTIAVLVEPGGDVAGAIDRLGKACARIARLKLD
jgi:hypothetical protein